MMKPYIIYIVFGLLFMCSCVRKTGEGGIELISLNLNIEEYPPIESSDYRLEFEIIPLENREECLTGKIDRVEIYDGKIYLKSLKEKYVMIFREDGKFLKRLTVGRGPGEIFFPRDILIDTLKRQLEVLDAYRSIKRYDLDGNYIDAVHFNESNIEFEKIGHRYVLYHANFNLKNDYHFTLLDSCGNMSYFLKKSGGIIDGYSYPRHFFHFDGNLYMLACFDHGIYRLGINDSLPEKVMQIEPLSSEPNMKPMKADDWTSYCQGKYFEYATDLKMFDNGRLLHIGVKRNGIRECILWDREQKQAYGWPLSEFPYLTIGVGHNAKEEIYVIPPHKLYELDDNKLTATGKRLRDLLVQTLKDKAADDENMYVVRVKFTKK